MEEQKDVNVNPVPETNVESNVPEVANTEKELDTTTPIQEKLADIEEKQNMVIPEVVKEVAEPAIEAAAQAVGDVPPKTEKVKVKKPTKRDPIIMYGNNVVMWYIEV